MFPKRLIALTLFATLAVIPPCVLRAQWQTSGPPDENVFTLAVNGSMLFAGTDDFNNTGVYLSTNNGNSWIAANNGLPNASILSLAVSGQNLFAGTVISGLYRSTDSGTSWVEMDSGIPPNSTIRIITVSGTNLFAVTSDSGIYRSTNNGEFWTASNSGLPNLSVYVLASIGNALYDGTFRSTDSGSSWQADSNFDLLAADVTSFSAVGEYLFAGTNEDGIFRSTDSGTSWSATSKGIPAYTGIEAFAVSGTNLFAGTEDGVFVSSNFGNSWKDVSTGLVNNFVTALSISKTYLFVGNSFGVSGRPLSELIDTAQAANDTQVVLFADSGTARVALSGDSDNYRSHRIDFVNNSSGTLVMSSASLASSNNRFLISQLSPDITDTIQPGEAFSMIILFFGDTLGTVYLDTIILSIGDPTRFYVFLTGNSFSAPNSGVSYISFAANSSAPWVYPNPFSQSTQISFTSPDAGYADISIVNLLGEQVARIFSGELDEGEHNFTFSNTATLQDGTYECLIRMNGQVQTLPVVLIH